MTEEKQPHDWREKTQEDISADILELRRVLSSGKPEDLAKAYSLRVEVLLDLAMADRLMVEALLPFVGPK